MRLDPAEYAEGPLPVLERPRFLAIVSSNTLAATMLRRANGRVDGLVIESPTAGGHNAPPRGKLQLNAAGEPVYGERDRVNMAELRALGVPFWLAGGYGSAGKAARGAGRRGGRAGGNRVCLQPRIGHAGRPEAAAPGPGRCRHGRGVYRSAGLAHRLSLQGGAARGHFVGSANVYEERKRVCDLGYLREPYAAGEARSATAAPRSRWTIMWPRAARSRTRWGANACATRCWPTSGYAQTRKDGAVEPALVTVGDDLNTIAQFLAPGRSELQRRGRGASACSSLSEREVAEPAR